jgi:hypothetical protein
MAILKAPAPVIREEPMQECENPACQRKGRSSMMINCIICIGSPGHPALEAFQCEAIEHWACSLECWKIVAHACIEEHMAEYLRQAHQKVGR